MTDPNKREVPTLEDELFEMVGTDDPEVVERRTLPSWLAIDLGIRPPWEGGPAPDWADVAVATAGFGSFILFDGVVMYAPLSMEQPPSTLPQAIVLMLMALGLGGVCVWCAEGRWRLFGVGLISGWVFLTLLSAGLFTGLG